MKHFLSLAILAALLLIGCTQYNLDDESIGDGDVRLTLIIAPFEKSGFDVNPASRTIVPVNEVCKRISFAVFDAGGKKVASANQDESTSSFGTLTANVNDGVYDIVIVGHSTGGNATISRPDSIRFKDNKLSDIFSYHEKLAISGNVSKQITLQRSVAMFRLVQTEPVPQEVKQLKFYYTGGSSTLNAVTNLGRVQSKQTEIIDVPQSAHTSKNTVFEVYTIPHETDDLLKMVITPLDADGDAVIDEFSLTDVPVTQGQITTMKGNLFKGNTPDVPSSPLGFSLSADNSWTERVFIF